MSQLHRIKALLNTESSDDGEKEDRTSPETKDVHNNPSLFSFPSTVLQRSTAPSVLPTQEGYIQSLEPQNAVPTALPVHAQSDLPSNTAASSFRPLLTHPTPHAHSFLPPTPAIHDHRHVIREQPIYSVYDYRYWPYEQPGLPASAGAAQSMPGPGIIPDKFGIFPMPKPRRRRACHNCRARKNKCEGDEPRCQSCVKGNLECKWPQPKKRGPKSGTKQATAKSVPDVEAPQQDSDKRAEQPPKETTKETADYFSGLNTLPSRTNSSQLGMQDQKDVLRRFYSDEVPDETRETVTYFFDYCYGICPIFHPASFVYRIVEGKVEKLLLDAMRAFVARIIMRKTGKKFDHDEIIKRIYQSLLLQLNDPSLDYVCAVVIAATMNGGEGDFIMFNSLSCMAVSLVTRLGWSTLDIDIKELPRTWEEWCTLEIKRRVFWLTYTNDCYQSFLGNRPITIGSLSPFVSAPKAEYTWEDMTVPQSSGWPCQTNISESNSDIVRNASVAHAFQDGCAIVSIMAKMGIFFWHFKVSLSSASTMNDNALNIRYRQNWSMKPIEIPQPLSNMLECAEFKALHERLARWRDGLVRAEDLKRHWSPSFLFSEFGSHKHRLHIMRVRYFCLYGHFVTAFIILHLSNRPSFFSTPACAAAAFKEPPLSTVASAEDKALRDLLAYAFPGAIHEGFLATDTLKESWDLCVDTVYEYVDFLKKNADIPLERYDHVIPISLFVCITVLIRSIRMCKQKIDDLAGGADQERQQLVRARKEIIKDIRALRYMWSLLTDLGAVWQVRGMTDLLRIMQVEEMSNTAELLSDLEL